MRVDEYSESSKQGEAIEPAASPCSLDGLGVCGCGQIPALPHAKESTVGEGAADLPPAQTPAAKLGVSEQRGHQVCECHAATVSKSRSPTARGRCHLGETAGGGG